MKRPLRPLAERLDPSRLQAPDADVASGRFLWPMVVLLIVSVAAAALFALLLLT